MEVLQKLDRQVRDQGAELKILGVGTTGYAKDILKDVIGADAALVETVAHTEAGLHFYDDVDVICDVGGQDIKIIILKNGRVKDFKLNTQCSAGNGYFLQSTAQGFNVPVEQYADTAFGAKGLPTFGYGCAVFMQTDIVDFQRQGWKPEEIMAGLCNVLPKNIWLYVSQIPNLSAIGTRFLLQGGTQYNLAAVKAQVDFIESRFKGKEQPADVIVHEHCGEAGRHRRGARSRPPVGQRPQSPRSSAWMPCQHIQYKTTRNEATRCYFCKNKCLRTFIDVKTNVINLGLQAAGEDQGAAGSGRAAADHRHLRKGHGGKHRGDAQHQGRPGQGQEGQPELRGSGRQGRVPRAGRAAGGRPAAASSRSPPRRRSAPS